MYKFIKHHTKNIMPISRSKKALILGALFLSTSSIIMGADNLDQDSQTHCSSPFSKVSFRDLPPELLVEIAKQSGVDEQNNLRLTSAKNHEVLSSTYVLSETDRAFDIRNEDDFRLFINKYNDGTRLSMPIILSGAWIRDDLLSLLENAAHLIIYDCDQITNEGLRNLVNVKTIILAGCGRITDAGLKYLANAITVDLSGCFEITDVGLKYLANAKFLYLAGCYDIQGSGLRYLVNATAVDLSDCDQITDAAKTELRSHGVKVIG